MEDFTSFHVCQETRIYRLERCEILNRITSTFFCLKHLDISEAKLVNRSIITHNQNAYILCSQYRIFEKGCVIPGYNYTHEPMSFNLVYSLPAFMYLRK